MEIQNDLNLRVTELSETDDDLIAIEQYELCAEIKKILDKKSKKNNGGALELI